MMKIKILCWVFGILLFVWAGAVLPQTEDEAISLAKEAQTHVQMAKSKDDYQHAAKKEDSIRAARKYGLVPI